jgi:hypothetical protein
MNDQDRTAEADLVGAVIGIAVARRAGQILGRDLDPEVSVAIAGASGDIFVVLALSDDPLRAVDDYLTAEGAL